MAEPAQSPNRRRGFVVDARWQLSVPFGIAALALGTGLLYFLGSYFLLANDPLESLSGTQTAYVALAVNAFYFVMLAGLLLAVALRITHAVAGPAMVLERAIEALRNGRFDSRTSLRKGDYLKSLAAAIQRLSLDLEQQRTGREIAYQDLEQAIGRGDRERAREILKSIRAPRSEAIPDQPPPEKASMERSAA